MGQSILRLFLGLSLILFSFHRSRDSTRMTFLKCIDHLKFIFWTNHFISFRLSSGSCICPTISSNPGHHHLLDLEAPNWPAICQAYHWLGNRTRIKIILSFSISFRVRLQEQWWSWKCWTVENTGWAIIFAAWITQMYTASIPFLQVFPPGMIFWYYQNPFHCLVICHFNFHTNQHSSAQWATWWFMLHNGTDNINAEELFMFKNDKIVELEVENSLTATRNVD